MANNLFWNVGGVKMEREVAALSVFIKPIIKKQYFGEVPNGFATPSIYFPVPEVASDEHSFSSYKNSYTIYAKVYGKNSTESYDYASKIVEKVQSLRKLIPLYDINGEAIGKDFRLIECNAKNIDVGVTQIEFTWNVYKDYYKPDVESAATVIINGLPTSEVKEDEDGTAE